MVDNEMSHNRKPDWSHFSKSKISLIVLKMIFCLFGACSEPVVPTGRSLVGIRFSSCIQALMIGGERKVSGTRAGKFSVRLRS